MIKKSIVFCLLLLSGIALEGMAQRTGNFMPIDRLSLAEYGQRLVIEVIDAGEQSHFRENGAITLAAYRAQFPDQASIVRYKFWGNQIVIFPRFATQGCISWINSTCNIVGGSGLDTLWLKRPQSPRITLHDR